MTSHPFTSRFVLSAAAALLFASPFVRAQAPDPGPAQRAVQTQLTAISSNKNLLNASATQLAEAVAAAMNVANSGTTGLTFAELAAAPLEPISVSATSAALPPSTVGKRRTDGGTSAPAIVTQAIIELQSGQIGLTGTGFNRNVALIAQALIDVNTQPGATPNTGLKPGDQGNTLKAAVAEVSDLGEDPAGASNYLGAIESISVLSSTDAVLQAIPKDGIAAVLQTALSGVVGTKGTSQASAPSAARYFALGLSGTGALSPSSLVTILKSVSSNSRVVNYFVNGIGTNNSSQSGLVTTGTTLINAYKSDVAQITQGLAAVTGTSDNEQDRSNFAQALVTSGSGKTSMITQATGIISGMAYVDPYYASKFTQDIFNAMITASGSSSAPVISIASTVATNLGTILGADGDELTDVAAVYSNFIQGGKLAPSNAATYIKNLITGAVKSKVVLYTNPTQLSAPDQGYGGHLSVATSGTMSFSVANDLASIADQIIIGVLEAPTTNLTTTNGLKSAASQVGSIAGDVASFIKNATFSDASVKNGATVSVGVYIAGSMADQITDSLPGLTQAEENSLFTAIINAVNGQASHFKGTVDGDVAFAVNTQEYEEVGPIAAQETPITNL